MKTLLSTSSCIPDTEQHPVFKLVIIYEDMLTGKRANYFCETLMQELGGAAHWIKDLWSFKVLDIPHARYEAAEAADVADVVILAISGDAELPEGIKAWMEEWGVRMVAREAGRNPILIALFGASDGRHEAVASTRAYLGEVAELAGLTFLHTLRHAAPSEEQRYAA